MAAPNWERRLINAALIVAICFAVYHIGRWVVYGPDHFTIEQTTPRVSSLDGMRYRVHEGHAGPQQAADTLAELNRRVIALMRHLRKVYVRGPAGDRYPERRRAVNRMLQRYNPDNLAENSPADPSGDTAYSLDKGAVIALCLRSKNTAENELHDIETLTFVTLHELTHIAVDVLDHPPVFWSTFKFILAEAEDAGIYVSPDYSREPRQYCGVKVDHNPIYDPGLPSI
jgi:hypothetical protein